MKIIDIKAFISTNRKVHVALVGGGSKDGILTIQRVPKGDVMVTLVAVKGDRGRPSVTAPANIESITWHTDAAAVVAKARKESVKAEPIKIKPRVKQNVSQPVQGKADCGCTAKLFCKTHHQARTSIASSKVNWQAISKCLDQMNADDLAQVIRTATTVLVARTSK